jgi:hypothetical protein
MSFQTIKCEMDGISLIKIWNGIFSNYIVTKMALPFALFQANPNSWIDILDG